MIRIALIGAGPNGAGNVKKLIATGRTSLVGVADINLLAAKKIAQEFGKSNTRVSENFQDIIDPADIVVISSPNFLHCEHAVTCAKAGKHLWIEKPMALSINEADQICSAVEQNKVKTFIGFSVRFSPFSVFMKEKVSSGEIGEIRSIWSRRLCLLNIPKGHWRKEYIKSGGVMSELIAHEIDWLIDIAGMPESVYCRKQSDLNDNICANDHVWLTFAFPNGATGTIEGSQNSLISDYYKGIIGSRGSIYDRAWGTELYMTDENAKEHRIETTKAFDKYSHFLDVVEGKTDSVADVFYGRKIVEISELA
ncbi:MAG TPA: Gfo/Idh/MocA family oxidoreductase, partial [Victivallales bacterium]|nr:Gfo/Idh/MocA family oxidoreductase [Victivallales bacterium]